MQHFHSTLARVKLTTFIFGVDISRNVKERTLCGFELVYSKNTISSSFVCFATGEHCFKKFNILFFYTNKRQKMSVVGIFMGYEAKLKKIFINNILLM